MKKKSIANKIFAIAFVLMVCFSSSGARLARALPVVDAGNIVQSTISAVANPVTAVATPAGTVAGVGTTVVSTAGWSFEAIAKNALDRVAYMAGQMMLNQLTDNIVSWVQGGFHGSPSFAIDVGQIEEDIIDAVAGDLINQIKDLSVCQFSVNYTDDLNESILLSTRKKRAQHIPKCPVDLSMNFYASDAVTAINSFGWSAFGSALSSSGNPYSVQVATAQELAKREQDSKGKSDKKMSWSNGFADVVDTTFENCNYPMEVKMAIKGTESTPDTTTIDPETGDEITIYGSSAYPPADAAQVKAYQKEYCKTTTPGKMVGDQIGKATRLDMDRLGFADNMNKIISAVLKQVTKQAVKGILTASGAHTSTTAPVNKLSVITLDATSVSQNSATLSGAVMSNSVTATAWFDWGKTLYFGESTAGKTLLGLTELTSTYNNETIGVLSPNTKYYYRAVTQNAKGRVYGNTLSFTTNP